MLAKREVEHTNDQFVFVDMVRQAEMQPVTAQPDHMDAWRAALRAHGLDRAEAFAAITPSTRSVSISAAGFSAAVPLAGQGEVVTGHGKPPTPCLPEAGCGAARFTLGTLPLRVFTSGHGFFMQHVQGFDGHAQHLGAGPARPAASVATVHFTFQYSDTPDFPHGKRQRAREAALWTADPASYYTEGRFVKLVGPLYTAAQRVAIERRYPEWSPHRHMAIDAIQRAAVRDLLALATAMNATMIMPPLVCTCDRYWGNTVNCRMPTAPQDMPLPFRCSQDRPLRGPTLTLTLTPTPTPTPTPNH